MTKPPPDRWRTLPRLVQVLLVTVGLVAMHQMGGGPHRMDMTAASFASGVATVDVSGHGTAMHPRAMPDQEVGPDLPAPAAAVVANLARVIRAVPDASDTSTALCLAVLLGLLLVTARRLAPASPTPGAVPLPGRHGTAPLGRGPPRLLLAKLCVLRT